jgi:hypothetical protein
VVVVGAAGGAFAGTVTARGSLGATGRNGCRNRSSGESGSAGAASIASAICSGETSIVRVRRATSASKLVVNGSSTVAVRDRSGSSAAFGVPAALAGSGSGRGSA